MKTDYKGWLYYLIFFATFFHSLALADEHDIVIIGNKTLPFESLQPTELFKVFTFKKDFWDEKTPINIVLLRRGDAHRKFISNYLNLRQGDYRRLCSNLKKRTKSMSPVIFKDEYSVLQHVRITKGAIGYVSTRTMPKGVKIIAIKK